MRLARPDQTPVLVGIGVATRQEEDYTRALEPLDLMLEAVRTAGANTGNPAVLAGVQQIAVPHGRWQYRNPARAIAHAIDAPRAQTLFASVGVLQQSLIGRACDEIARGGAHTTLVVGGDCGYRLLRAQIAGHTVTDRVIDDAPDLKLAPKEELFHAVEKALGLVMPVGLYAILESAYRAQRGFSVAEHRDRLGAMYAGFSAIATENPHAWKRERWSPSAVCEAGAKNPLQAFPYTRAMCSTFNVDQAAALLFCSAARAIELGVPRERWIFPVASTESNHMVPVSARADLAACPGAGLAGRAALAAGNLSVNAIDLLDLYNCFPVAVEIYAQELGISLTRSLSITGGMSFAGGPWNNYVLQATCRAAELMRAGHGDNALLSSVSGLLTKQGFGLWSREPPREFRWQDVSSEVATIQRTVDVHGHYSGPATLAGYTVLYARNEPPKALALVDTPDGKRALTTGYAAELISAFESVECVGRNVVVLDNVLTRAA